MALRGLPRFFWGRLRAADPEGAKRPEKPAKTRTLRSAAVTLDPRTPVLVGVGQVTERPDPDLPLAERQEPVQLMARALRAAAEDSAPRRVAAAVSWPGPSHSGSSSP